jgi:hypothetical protein
MAIDNINSRPDQAEKKSVNSRADYLKAGNPRTLESEAGRITSLRSVWATQKRQLSLFEITKGEYKKE